MNIGFPFEPYKGYSCQSIKTKKAPCMKTVPDGKAKKANEAETYLEMIQNKIEELSNKIANGDIETSYQIGGQSYTEREWNKLLEHFDAIEEVIRKNIEKEIEERKERLEEEELQREDALEKKLEEERKEILLMNQISFHCVEDGQDTVYVIAYDSTGMRCMKQGCEKEIWKLVFEDKQQYEKILVSIQDLSVEKVQFTKQEFWISLIADEYARMKKERSPV